MFSGGCLTFVSCSVLASQRKFMNSVLIFYAKALILQWLSIRHAGTMMCDHVIHPFRPLRGHHKFGFNDKNTTSTLILSFLEVGFEIRAEKSGFCDICGKSNLG